MPRSLPLFRVILRKCDPGCSLFALTDGLHLASSTPMEKLAIWELSQRDQCEAVIQRHRDEFIRGAKALRIIRDRVLYREEAPNWDAYCQAQFGMSGEWMNEMIRLAEGMTEDP